LGELFGCHDEEAQQKKGRSVPASSALPHLVVAATREVATGSRSTQCPALDGDGARPVSVRIRF